jgi:tellurite resistance protein TehA-like permease
LAFGVRDQWSAVNLTNIGYICMAVGVLAIVLALVMNAQRSRTHTEIVERHEAGPPTI